MIETIVQIGGIVAFFTIFDQIVYPEEKRVISVVIFGKKDVKLQDFDWAILTGFLQCFINKNGNLSAVPIYLFSLAVSLISYLVLLGISGSLFGLFRARDLSDLLTSIPGAVVLALIGSVVSHPFDLFSF